MPAKTNYQQALDALTAAGRINDKQLADPVAAVRLQVQVDTANTLAILAVADEIRTTRQTLNVISATLANIQAKAEGMEAAARGIEVATKGIQLRADEIERMGHSVVNSLSIIERIG